MRRGWRRYLLVLVALALSAPLGAQQTAADTAAVLVQAARELDVQGYGDAARELLRFVVRRYPSTPAAAEARSWLEQARDVRRPGSGRNHFVFWNTLFASWLGVVTPAAFGASEPTPYGLGLLVGAPAGLFGALAYTRNYPITAGQAGLYSLSTLWGTWQAMGWRAVLELGAKESCSAFGCVDTTPDEAPWVAALAGGVAGIGLGIALTKLDVADGTATLVRHASLWGTGLGLGFGIAAGQEDDALLTWVLVAGNVALLGAIPGAGAWRPTDSEVRLTSAGGLAGAAAGLGVSLLVNPQDGDEGFLYPTIGAATGLIVAAVLVTSRRDRLGGRPGGGDPPGDALLSLGGRLQFDLPLPQAGTQWTLGPDGRPRRQPTLEFRLVRASF